MPRCRYLINFVPLISKSCRSQLIEQWDNNTILFRGRHSPLSSGTTVDEDDVVRWWPLCEYDPETMLLQIIIIQESAIQLRWKYIFVAGSRDMGPALARLIFVCDVLTTLHSKSNTLALRYHRTSDHPEHCWDLWWRYGDCGGATAPTFFTYSWCVYETDPPYTLLIYLCISHCTARNLLSYPR